MKTAIILSSLAVLGAAGCGEQNQGSEYRVYSSEYAEYFDASTLQQAAEAVAIVSVASQREEALPDIKDVLFTVSTVKIVQVVAGAVDAETIDVWQMGTSNSSLADTLIRPGTDALLFLVHYSVPSLEDSKIRYIPVGGDQGVYFADGSSAFTLVGAERPLTNPGLVSVDSHGAVSTQQWAHESELAVACVDLANALSSSHGSDAASTLRRLQALSLEGLDPRLSHAFSLELDALEHASTEVVQGTRDEWSTENLSQSASAICGKDLDIVSFSRTK